MIITASTPFGLYCPEHGLFFVSMEEYNDANKRYCRTPNCEVMNCEQEDKLLNLTFNQGCTFCGKIPVESPSIYLPKFGYLFCGVACERCSWGICTYSDCKNQAAYVVVLFLDDELEPIIIPIVLCVEHKRSVPRYGTRPIWKYINESMRFPADINGDVGVLRVKKLRTGRKGE